MCEEIDFFRGLGTPDDKKEEAANMRYQELKAKFGEEIAASVKTAHKQGDLEEVKRLQEKAKSKAFIIVASEFGEIPSRENAGAIGPRDGDSGIDDYFDAFNYPDSKDED